MDDKNSSDCQKSLEFISSHYFQIGHDIYMYVVLLDTHSEFFFMSRSNGLVTRLEFFLSRLNGLVTRSELYMSCSNSFLIRAECLMSHSKG